MAMVEVIDSDNMEYNQEFKSEDDAWYSVKVVLSGGDGAGGKDVEEGTTLTVKFEGFPDTHDVRFNAGDFQTEPEIDELVKRFRPVSKQLQDKECSVISEDMTVCAALRSRDDDLRYYDAVVEAVHYQQHSFAKGEEECLCTFVLLWLHGPNMGNLTAGTIANICTIQTAAPIDLSITSFSELAKKRLEVASSKSGVVSEPHISTSRGPSSCKELSLSSYNQHPSFESGYQMTQTHLGSVLKWKAEGSSSNGIVGAYGERRDIDEDFGGDDSIQHRSDYILLIDNLEKDLSPSYIKQFIHEYTFISPDTYVFPSRSSDQYAVGAIVESKMNLEKIYEFLINPRHMIVSARGRPWVIMEKVRKHDIFGKTLDNLPLECQVQFQKTNFERELKVVYLGTEAYSRAEHLRELFVDFVDHLKELHKRLAYEESRILESSQ